MAAKILIVVLTSYVVCYAMYRNYSTVDHDGEAYVMYPDEPRGYYYAFRPIGFLDEVVTGRKSHLGPFEQ